MSETWSTYDEYLQTRLWTRIRLRVLRRDNRQCVRCGGRAREVHHRSYDRDVLEGRANHKLVSLCRGCHESIEVDENGRKRTHEEVERFLATPAGTDIPSIVIKGKKRPKLLPPHNAGRLSSSQLGEYHARGFAAMQSIATAAAEATVARRFRHPREPIDSNLLPTDQILWVLSRCFGNKPTAYREFCRYLPDQVVDNPSYWLRRAGDELEWHNPGCRAVLDRVFSARPSAVERLEQELSKGDQIGWNPLKDRPVLLPGPYAKRAVARAAKA